MEALRRLSGIAMGRASSALSELTGQTILVSGPKVQVLAFGEALRLVNEGDGPVAGVSLGICGDATGRVLVILPQESAFALIGLLTGRRVGWVAALSEEDCSVIREVGNILASSYLSALGDLLRIRLIPTPPQLYFDRPGPALEVLLPERSPWGEKALVVEAHFGDPHRVIQGQFLLLSDPSWSFQVY